MLLIATELAAELIFALLDEETATLEGWLLATELTATLDAGALLIIIGVLEVLPVGPSSSVALPPHPESTRASNIDKVEENKCLYIVTP